jgi:hypothetical protein
VIAPGDPPLTEAMVQRYTDALAWLYGLQFTPAQRQKMRGFVIGYWTSDNAAQIKGVLDGLNVEAAIAGKTPAERDYLRQRIFPGLLKQARQQQDPETVWLLSLY